MFIGLFPVIRWSFLWTFVHQIASIILLFFIAEKRGKKSVVDKKFNTSTWILFAIHMFIAISSIWIHLVAVEDAATGTYHF